MGKYKAQEATRAEELDRVCAKICELAARQKPLEQCTPDEARQLRESRGNPFAPPPTELAGVEDHFIPVASGQMLARIYRPLTDMDEFGPALVYFHGGGYVLGSVAGHDTVTRQLASLASTTIISVEYRLAPESRAKETVQEGFEAFTWLRDHATALGLDAGRIGIGGDSAGGNLAIAVSLLCIRQQLPVPASLLLFYPITDWRIASASYEEFAEGYFLTRSGMHWFRDHFLDDPAQAEDPLYSPLLSGDLGHLPPTLVITAGFDPLRDEGKQFADQVRAAGVAVEHICYQDVIHAFVSFAGGVPQGMDALQEAARHLVRTLRAASQET